LSLAKELKQLRFAYILSFLFVVIMTIAVFYECFAFGDYQANFAKASLFELKGVSSTFCTAVFAYSCHPNALDIFKELYNPSQRRIEKVIRRSLMITVGAYLLIGVFGYVTFVSDLSILNSVHKANGVILFAYGYGQDGKGDGITFPPLIYAVLLMEGFSLIILEPLTIKPAKDSLQSMVYGKGTKITTAKHVLMATICVYSVVAVSFFVEDLASLVNVIGASLLSLTCFIMPASFYLKLKRHEPFDMHKALCWIMAISSALFGTYATYINFIYLIDG